MVFLEPASACNTCPFHSSITLPSLNVDLDPGGYLEDLGLILGILAIMVNSIWKPLKKEADSSIQIEKFMENGREILISDFGFRSTFNEGSVKAF